ncbi:MAG: flavin reductase family protein [Clostridiaceae bacterium]
MSKVSFKAGTLLNPVPVVLVSSKNKEGKINVFTVAWAGTICTKPPMLSISVRPSRLSYEYIKETLEFVVNIPSVNLTKKVDFCGVKSGSKFDKIKECDFNMKDSEIVNVPYIDNCPISLECKVKDIIPLGSHDLFTAEIVNVLYDDNLMDSKGKLHLEKANLLCYNHGEYYGIDKKRLGTFGFSVKKK